MGAACNLIIQAYRKTTANTRNHLECRLRNVFYNNTLAHRESDLNICVCERTSLRVVVCRLRAYVQNFNVNVDRCEVFVNNLRLIRTVQRYPPLSTACMILKPIVIERVSRATVLVSLTRLPSVNR